MILPESLPICIGLLPSSWSEKAVEVLSEEQRFFPSDVVTDSTDDPANLIQCFIGPLCNRQDNHWAVATVEFTLESGKEFFPTSPVNHVEDQQPGCLRHLGVRASPTCRLRYSMQECSDFSGGGLKWLVFGNQGWETSLCSRVAN
jgi:hypothetical protein